MEAARLGDLKRGQPRHNSGTAPPSGASELVGDKAVPDGRGSGSPGAGLPLRGALRERGVWLWERERRHSGWEKRPEQAAGTLRVLRKCLWDCWWEENRDVGGKGASGLPAVSGSSSKTRPREGEARIETET